MKIYFNGKRIDYYSKRRFNWKGWMLKMWAKYVAPAIIVSLLATVLMDTLDNNVVFAVAMEQKPSPAIVVVKDSTIPPVLQRISQCESSDEQFEHGHPLYGHMTSGDIGYYQINRPTWSAKAKELGFDLATKEGNEKMALFIYATRGTEDWYASKKCWLH